MQTNTFINKNINLDIVRIIGALMVMFVHIGFQFGDWVYKYTWEGFYGTTLFFILSGYLVMTSMSRCESALIFYKKRIVHIIPLYWSILLINYIIKVISAFPNGGISVFSLNGPCGIKYLRYFLFVNMIFPSNDYELWNNMLGFWTMSNFFFFYLVTPLIYKIIKKYNVALIVLILVLYFQKDFVEWFTALLSGSTCIAISSPSEYASLNPLSMFYAYFLGVTIYFAHKEAKQFSLAILFVLSMIYLDFEWFAWDIAFALLVLLAVEVPVSLSIGQRTSQIISSFASFSFALYLSHNITLNYIMKLQGVLIPIIRNKGFLILTVIICICVAYLIWRFIEKPLTAKLSHLLFK